MDKPAPRREPLDMAVKPGRSMLDRIERPRRSASPEKGTRRSDTRKPAPEHIDRYVPGEDDRPRRSPLPRRGGREGGRRPGQRREQGRRNNKDGDGHMLVQGRPRKTMEELDAEMQDYWGTDDAPSAAKGTGDVENNTNGAVNGAPAVTAADDDIEMVE